MLSDICSAAEMSYRQRRRNNCGKVALVGQYKDPLSCVFMEKTEAEKPAGQACEDGKCLCPRREVKWSLVATKGQKINSSQSSSSQNSINVQASAAKPFFSKRSPHQQQRLYATDVEEIHVNHFFHQKTVAMDPYGLPIFIASLADQESEIWSLVEYLRPTAEESKDRLDLFRSISKITDLLFAGSQLARFGSSVNGFSLRSADLDFCLFVENKEDSCSSSSTSFSSDVLSRLGSELSKNGRFSQVKVLLRARVPIIKLKDTLTGISCDIGVNNRLALHNTRLLQLYGQIDPRVIPLALVVKWWAKKRSMNDSYRGTLSSYCLLMMLIFYLQQEEHPVLPALTGPSFIDEMCKSRISLAPDFEDSGDPVSRLFGSLSIENDCQQGLLVDTFVDNFPVRYVSDIGSILSWKKEKLSQSPSGHNLIVPLLSGFFKFYAQTFPYSTETVSPRLGRGISKESRGWTIQVP